MNSQLVAVTAVLILLGPSALISQTRIAIIDSDKLITELPAYQEAEKKMEEFRDQKQDTLNRMNKNLEDRVSAYQAQQAMMTDEARSEEENKLRQIQQNMVEFQRGYEQEIVDLRKSLMQPIRDKVLKAVNEIAVKLGYDVVLDKASPSVVFNTSAIDITDKVAEKL